LRRGALGRADPTGGLALACVLIVGGAALASSGMWPRRIG
jgi:hypothetical protein